KLFSIICRADNAWGQHSPKLRGNVFLRRLPNSDRIVALSARSPWLQCLLRYDEQEECFICPCHLHEHYGLDGLRLSSNHTPGDLESLEVKVCDGQVWVLSAVEE